MQYQYIVYGIEICYLFIFDVSDYIIFEVTGTRCASLKRSYIKNQNVQEWETQQVLVIGNSEESIKDIWLKINCVVEEYYITNKFTTNAYYKKRDKKKICIITKRMIKKKLWCNREASIASREIVPIVSFLL